MQALRCMIQAYHSAAKNFQVYHSATDTLQVTLRQKYVFIIMETIYFNCLYVTQRLLTSRNGYSTNYCYKSFVVIVFIENKVVIHF